MSQNKIISMFYYDDSIISVKPVEFEEANNILEYSCCMRVILHDVCLCVSARVTQLMEHLDVFISVKPKPKQPSKVSLQPHTVNV